MYIEKTSLSTDRKDGGRWARANRIICMFWTLYVLDIVERTVFTEVAFAILTKIKTIVTRRARLDVTTLIRARRRLASRADQSTAFTLPPSRGLPLNPNGTFYVSFTSPSPFYLMYLIFYLTFYILPSILSYLTLRRPPHQPHALICSSCGSCKWRS
jgi:hypothetical protein